MQPIIKSIQEKQLIGIHKEMSLTENKTSELFREFMPRRKEIHHLKDNNTFEMMAYPHGYFRSFNPSTKFTKWALAEVSAIDNIPSNMLTYTLVEGQYAVFHYKGLSSDSSIYEYIFSKWLPNAPYQLDDRPHFNVLGEKTKINDPDSEEEIWIPIKSM